MFDFQLRKMNLNRIRLEICVGKIIFFLKEILYRLVKGFLVSESREKNILRINYDNFFRNFQNNFLKIQPLILSLGIDNILLLSVIFLACSLSILYNKIRQSYIYKRKLMIFKHSVYTSRL